MSEYQSIEEGVDALHALWSGAEAAGVVWSYRLSLRARTDPDYQPWLAHVYVCRTIGVDPRDPPTVLGPAPLRPTVINQGELERDLDALGDYACRPLHDFAERRPSPVRRECGTDGGGPVPAE